MYRIILGLLGITLLFTHLNLCWSQEHKGIPVTSSLQQDAEIAKQDSKPILLMISQDHCPYCDLIKREVLHPMELSGDYKSRILMREILIDMSQTITNFQGREQDAAAFSHAYGVHLTPTLLFLDPQGNELAQRIIGINTVEMFSFYLDAAIDEATEKMQAQHNTRTQ